MRLKNFDKALKAQGFTPQKVAEMSGLGLSSVYRLLREEEPEARPSTVKKLQKVLGEPLRAEDDPANQRSVLDMLAGPSGRVRWEALRRRGAGELAGAGEKEEVALELRILRHKVEALEEEVRLLNRRLSPLIWALRAGSGEYEGAEEERSASRHAKDTGEEEDM